MIKQDEITTIQEESEELEKGQEESSRPEKEEESKVEEPEADKESEETESEESDMESHLNPDAAEFVPVLSPTPPLIPPRVKDDLVAGSPLKQSNKALSNRAIPSEVEFAAEISRRPHELNDEDNDLVADIGITPLKSKDPFNFDVSEISSTKAEYGDESSVSRFSVMSSDLTSTYNKTSDVMNTSMTPDDFKNVFETGPDLNKVHDLTDEDLCIPEVNGVKTEEKLEMEEEEDPIKHELKINEALQELGIELVMNMKNASETEDLTKGVQNLNLNEVVTNNDMISPFDGPVAQNETQEVPKTVDLMTDVAPSVDSNLIDIKEFDNEKEVKEEVKEAKKEDLVVEPKEVVEEKEVVAKKASPIKAATTPVTKKQQQTPTPKPKSTPRTSLAPKATPRTGTTPSSTPKTTKPAAAPRVAQNGDVKSPKMASKPAAPKPKLR